MAGGPFGRRCHDCGRSMAPFMPRKRAGDKERLLCPSCKQVEQNREEYRQKSAQIHVGQTNEDYYYHFRANHGFDPAMSTWGRSALKAAHDADHDKGPPVPHDRENLAPHTIKESLRREAHDSGDSETLYHCPFCGAGQLVSRSDNTTECQYCGTVFTVQVQPKQQGMPQTINGQPMDMPGMPGDPMEQPPGSVTDTPNRAEGQPGGGGQAGPPGTPMGPPNIPAPPPGGGPPGSGAQGPPGADGGLPGQGGQKPPPPQGGGPPGSGDKTPPGAKGKGQPPQGGGPPGSEKKPEGPPEKGSPEKDADEESKSDDGKKKPPWLGQPKSSAFFMTHRGIALPEDAYVRYMALRHAEGAARDEILDQIRQERGAA